MSNDDVVGAVKGRVDASYVLSRGLPTAAQMAWGFRHGWITAEDLVTIATHKSASHCPSGFDLELAVLLQDDLEAVTSIVDEFNDPTEPDERAARFWLYIAMAFVLENRGDFADPLQTVEWMYAEFGYPDEVAQFVRYMPASNPETASVETLNEDWARWVAAASSEFSHISCRRMPESF